MSAYICYVCDQLKDSDEAYLIEADGIGSTEGKIMIIK